jgi:hypothetical protein
MTNIVKIDSEEFLIIAREDFKQLNAEIQRQTTEQFELVIKEVGQAINLVVDARTDLTQVHIQLNQYHDKQQEELKDIEDLDKLSEIDKTSLKIKEYINKSAVSLQFEDMTRQVLEHISERCMKMREQINLIQQLEMEFIMKNDRSENALSDHLDKMHTAHNKSIQYFSKLDEAKAVSQTSMDEGDVNLF